MDDRKLLELAAKAYGLEKCHYSARSSLGHGIHHSRGIWNPLTDDGDALRLAVKLGFGMCIDHCDRFVVVEDEQIFYDETKFGGSSDPYAATRRCIVLAAAEVGRNM